MVAGAAGGADRSVVGAETGLRRHGDPILFWRSAFAVPLARRPINRLSSFRAGRRAESECLCVGSGRPFLPNYSAQGPRQSLTYLPYELG
jgi:hypothetical protein